MPSQAACVKLAFLNSSGKVDELIYELYNKANGFNRTLFHDLINLRLILSGPLALLVFNLSISSLTSDCKIGAEKNEPLILPLRYRLKQDPSFSIFLSKLQPVLLKQIIESICYCPIFCYCSAIHL